MEPSSQKVRKCLKCGRTIEEGWLCERCREQNRKIQEQYCYIIHYPDRRYWAWPY